ncbi:hypothetical protein [Clostridium sp.]|uniref:hypothetical protein n=1 Tax=Clostridium sp. TaxID=1506 RepID=UPI002FC783F5
MFNINYKKYIPLSFFSILIINILIVVLNYKYNIIIFSTSLDIFLNIILLILGSASIPYISKKAIRNITITTITFLIIITCFQIDSLSSVNKTSQHKTFYSANGDNSIDFIKSIEPGWPDDEIHVLEVIQNKNFIIRKRVALLSSFDGIGYELKWINNTQAILRYKCYNKLSPGDYDISVQNLNINF